MRASGCSGVGAVVADRLVDHVTGDEEREQQEQQAGDGTDGEKNRTLKISRTSAGAHRIAWRLAGPASAIWSSTSSVWPSPTNSAS